MFKLSVLDRQTKTEELIPIFQNLGWFRTLFYSQSASRSKAWGEMADMGEETSCIHKNNFDQRPELAKKRGKKICKLWSLRNWTYLRTELFQDPKSALFALSPEPGLGWILSLPAWMIWQLFVSLWPLEQQGCWLGFGFSSCHWCLAREPLNAQEESWIRFNLPFLGN